MSRLKLAICFVLPLLITSVFICKDSLAQKKQIEKAFREDRKGNLEGFRAKWRLVLQSIDSADRSEGRLVVKDYPHQQWPAVSQPVDNGTGLTSLHVCDFANDYLEHTFRQDWYKQTSSDRFGRQPIDILSLEKRTLFSSPENENLTLVLKQLRSPNFIANSTPGQPTAVDVPGNSRMEWPSAIDMRIVGWCSRGQVIFPTSAEQWKNIMARFEPFSMEEKNGGKEIRFLLIEKHDEIFSWLWTYEAEVFEESKMRLSAITKHRIVRRGEDSLFCLETPFFMSRFHYQGSDLVAVATAKNDSQECCRFEFETRINPEPVPSYFDVHKLGSAEERIFFRSSVNEKLKQEINAKK